jgi:molybdopterin-synthase adenylyltransferase
MLPFSKPLVPSHFQIWCEPPDDSGDEILRIVSTRRSLTLKGHSFREFHRQVLPLLDGHHSLEEIHSKTSHVFNRGDLENALVLLSQQQVIVEGDGLDMSLEENPRLTLQMNYFHEIADEGRFAQRRLAAARVVIFGLGGAGPGVMIALSAAGIGRLTGVDDLHISAADTYLSPALTLPDIGRLRSEVIAKRIKANAPDTLVNAVTTGVDSEEDIGAIVEGADFVVSCLDAGFVNLAYKLNRVCRARSIPWISGELSGAEVIVGPAFYHEGGACYMCYRMRAIACAANPQTSFAQERHLDKLKMNLSDRRENLVFGAGILANMLGVEVMNVLSGLADPALNGRVIVFDLTTLRQQKHVVLRKPGCPVCAGSNVT